MRRSLTFLLLVLLLGTSAPVPADAARYIRLNGHVRMRGNIRLAGIQPPVTLGPIAINTNSLSGGTVSVAYSQSVSASGGMGSGYTYAVTSGTLPSGLSISSGGAITGIPSGTGTSNFTVSATDSRNNIGYKNLSITISAAPTITLTGSLPDGTQNVSYSQTVTASGGTGPYTYAVTSGSVPAGTSLSSGGVLSGTPSSYGSSSFTITATDANSFTGSQAYTINVAQRVFAYTISSNTNKANLYTIAGSPAGGTGYTYNFTVNGGVTVYSDTTATAAMTVSGFAAGATVTITNNGSIIGMGGNGGAGANANPPNAGGNGGPGISTTINLTITNNGLIAGGGGGGGGTFRGPGGGGGQSYSATSGGGVYGFYDAYREYDGLGVGVGGNSSAGGRGGYGWTPGGNVWGTGSSNGSAGGFGGNGGAGWIGGGGGGGGYGASGGQGGSSDDGSDGGGFVTGAAGGSGGAAVSRGGNTVTWLATGTRYGSY